ncbi:flagella synthesis protein FlgN [Marinobacter oulmenensis]|uniref:Flagella synthesis protein FlgN n=1 Tax=Marinobacter oulmenensis TaxID=643747 RepID=A0A840U3X8_9GAMM|nr:flagellar protein FlgN [Marinobacter oulmenensis]MBB5320404.1 flagella synthesis protein FlgN [Marinobacter oulmenensis]
MAAIDDLKQLLQEDIRQLDNLTDVLSREKTTLSSSDISELQGITSEKNAILEAIRERAKRKIHLLVSMGYKPTAGAPSRFIRAAGMDDLYQLWQQADEKLRACQSLNQNNGRVVGHLQKRLGRLTDIFRGASSQQKLYGAKGEQTRVSSSTVLASA